MTTTTDQEALDLAARTLQTLQDSLAHGAHLATAAQEAGKPLPPARGEEMAAHFTAAQASARQLHQLLVHGLGAQNPGLRVNRDSLRLDQLDTPATRRLLVCLQEALSAAQLVDEERGWVDASGEGIGLAESVGALELVLRREVLGTEGSGRE